MKTYINPTIITWARKKSGLTIEALAEKMKREPSEIVEWENKGNIPSYSILEQLAYKHLKIPIAIFFFPQPPEIDDPQKRFRRLPSYELDRLSPDTYQKIRIGQAYQDSLSVLLPRVSKQQRIFRELSPHLVEPEDLAKQVRQYLGVTVDQQFLFRSAETAFKAWRHAIEEVSVFAFKDSFKDRFVSGFSLIDDDYPIIFINNSNAFSRQVFTLIHELGHILYGVSGITDIDESYISMMTKDQREIEIKCNEFTSHLLVPDTSFKDDIRYFRAHGPESISGIAEHYSISREVILRKLLDHGEVNSRYYEQKAAEWNKEYLAREKKTAGGNFYLTHLAYLGEGFSQLAFENYHRGRINSTDLADHLNINARYLSKLEKYMR
jgi:Zn-dependent peptidase ImmA (M78 family)